MRSTSDSFGIEFRIGGRVRLADTGRVATVRAFTSRGSVCLDEGDHPDPIARGRAIGGGHLGILQRDGADGYEGNRGDD